MSGIEPIVRLDPFGHLVFVVKKLVEILETRIRSLESGGSGGGGGIGTDEISHHALLDLADGDDHPQYFLNPGRTGEILQVMADIVSAGSIDALGNIQAGYRTTSTTMTCANAPVNPTDVLRLADISALVPLHTVAAGTWEDSSSSNTTPGTMYYDVVGSTVSLYQTALVQITVNNSFISFSPAVQIPSQYLPKNDINFPIVVLTGSGNVVAILSIHVASSPNQVFISPSGATNFPAPSVEVLSFMVSWSTN